MKQWFAMTLLPGALSVPHVVVVGEEDGFTRTFGEDPKDLGPTGVNPFFLLEPGHTLVLEGMEDGNARGIGVIQDGGMKLTRHGKNLK